MLHYDITTLYVIWGGGGGGGRVSETLHVCVLLHQCLAGAHFTFNTIRFVFFLYIL